MSKLYSGEGSLFSMNQALESTVYKNRKSFIGTVLYIPFDT